MTRSALVSRTLLACLALLSAGAVGTTPAADAAPVADASAAVDLGHLDVDVSALPVSLHRRAADFLELERERVSSPWVGGRLAAHALPMTRPGHAGPTHYEFRVVSAEDTTIGSFILSTGEHDHPVPVAVEEGPSRSELLAAQLTSPADASQVHFFSAASMVVEDRLGRAVATFGSLPPKVVRLERAWLDDDASKHDAELGTWSSWQELREGYADNYAVAHEVMRRNAADDWEQTRRVEAAVEGLQPGWFREVPLLSRDGARVAVVGSGARHVRVERYQRGLEGDEALAVFVEGADAERVDEVTLDIGYGDGSSEVRRFAIAANVPDLDAPLPSGVLAAPVKVSTDGPECVKAVVRSAWDTYVYAQDGGGGELAARGGWIGGWEIFRFDASRRKLRLRASNGQYVRAVGGGGGAVRADGTNSDPDTQLFRNAYADGTVKLETRKGHAIRAQRTGAVDAVGDAGSHRFRLEYCSPKRLEGHWAAAHDPIAAMRKVRKYSQLRGSQGPNAAPCASGCGATAWAMLFGWVDHMAHAGDPKWAHYKGMYRRDGAIAGPDAEAPEFMWTDMPRLVQSIRKDHELEAGVGKIVEEIRRYLDDWGAAGCTTTGSRFTAPQIMAQARQYVDARDIDIGLTAEYDGIGAMTAEGRNNALKQIEDHDQVVAIGIGWLSHYPLAYGYERARFIAWDAARRRWSRETLHQRFVVNMGWGQYGSENVPFDSWFAGYLTAKAAPPPIPVYKPAKPLPKPSTPQAVPDLW